MDAFGDLETVITFQVKPINHLNLSTGSLSCSISTFWSIAASAAVIEAAASEKRTFQMDAAREPDELTAGFSACF